MKQGDWQDWQQTAEAGPWPIFWCVLGAVVAMAFILSVVGYGCGWFGGAAQVASKEFGAAEMLRKYEWFKDASAALDKKQADIKVYAVRLSTIEQAYKGKQRAEWARDDREQYNIWQSEVSGVKASYNGLAAEYNSQMAKFNWRFANAGTLPEGAAIPLPREYKPYIEE